MAGGIDQGEAGVLLACSMNGTAYPRATGSYLAQCTSNGTATVPGTEMVAGGYTRPLVPFTINVNVATNTNPVTVTALPAGTIRQIATYDASALGNRRWWTDLTANITVNAGDAISYAAGAIQFQLGA